MVAIIVKKQLFCMQQYGQQYDIIKIQNVSTQEIQKRT